MFVCLFVCLLFVCLFVYFYFLFFYLFIYLFICLLVYFTESVADNMNNSIVRCSFFTSLTSTARLNLIGQPDTPKLYIVTANYNSVSIKIDFGNTRGSPISEIRITLPSHVWSNKLNPAKWLGFNFKITGLQSDTSYVVRIRCWNGYRWSTEGAIEVTTLKNENIIPQTQPPYNPNTNPNKPTSNASQSIASFYIIFLLLLVPY